MDSATVTTKQEAGKTFDETVTLDTIRQHIVFSPFTPTAPQTPATSARSPAAAQAPNAPTPRVREFERFG
jgi:hypothetical protein